MTVRGGEKEQKKKKEKEECLSVKRTGVRKGRWERRRQGRDEVMGVAECRGIGGEGGSWKKNFISGANKGKQLRYGSV